MDTDPNCQRYIKYIKLGLDRIRKQWDECRTHDMSTITREDTADHAYITEQQFENLIMGVEGSEEHLVGILAEYDAQASVGSTPAVTSESKYIVILFQQPRMGMLGFPDFWPTPESAMVDQVTETEEADRRTLSPFTPGRCSKALRLCCSGGKIAIQILCF